MKFLSEFGLRTETKIQGTFVPDSAGARDVVAAQGRSMQGHFMPKIVCVIYLCIFAGFPWPESPSIQT